MATELRPPIRALWLIDSLSLGGAETLALSLSKFSERLDAPNSRLDIQLAALKSGLPGLPQAHAKDAAVWRLDSRGLRDRRALSRLVARARSFRPHLIHAHLTDATIWGEIVARRLGIPSAVTLHVDPDGRSPLGPVSSRMRKWLERRALRRANGVAGVSRAVAERWRRDAGLAGRRLKVIPNGVDTQRFQPVDPDEKARIRSVLGIPADRIVISTVAVLRAGKGIRAFVDAIGIVAAGNSNVQALIVGEGPEENRLRESATDVGDRIRFLGGRDDVDSILSASDLFVLASEREALPTVLLEAMASGLPIVATDVGGVPEAVTHETSGLLVPPGSAEALAVALIRLISHPEQAHGMASASRLRAEEGFSLDAWQNRLVEWYDELLESHPSRRPEPLSVESENAVRHAKVVSP